MGNDTNAVVLGSEDRRAVADALRIATRTKDRPALRSVIVADGLAMVTDTYVAVRVPALGQLPAGAWDADALAAATKGAGSEGVRIAADGPDALRVDRFAITVRGRTSAALAIDYGDGVPVGLVAGTFRVPAVDGAPNVATIYRQAVEAVTADTYVPELVGFAADRITDVLAARPHARERGAGRPVRILPNGYRAAVVTEGGEPFAVVMPMRD